MKRKRLTQPKHDNLFAQTERAERRETYEQKQRIAARVRKRQKQQQAAEAAEASKFPSKQEVQHWLRSKQFYRPPAPDDAAAEEIKRYLVRKYSNRRRLKK